MKLIFFSDFRRYYIYPNRFCEQDEFVAAIDLIRKTVTFCNDTIDKCNIQDVLATVIGPIVNYYVDPHLQEKFEALVNSKSVFTCTFDELFDNLGIQLNCLEA